MERIEHPPPAGYEQILPPALDAALRRATRAEQRATGSARRHAFRTTRYLIGAAVELGYPPAAIAESLGVTTGSIRNRAAGSGLFVPAAVASLAGVDPEAVDAWRRRGWLPEPTIAPDGQPSYPAPAAVRAMIIAASSPA